MTDPAGTVLEPFRGNALARMPRVAFVVGAERSGGALVRLMLDAHPKLSFAHQLEFAVEWVGDDGSFPELEDYVRALQSDALYRRSGLSVSAAGHEDYRSLASDFLLQRRRGADVVGGIVHHNFHRLPFVWPDAKYIHLLRDPRAVARSWVRAGMHGNVWGGVDEWMQAELRWDRLATAIPPGAELTICYEALLCDPERELARVCEFLDVPYDPVMLHIDHDAAAVDGYDDLERWFHLSTRELALLEAKLGPWLERRGYPRITRRTPGVGAWQRWMLRAEDRMARARFRKQRYGLRLWAESLVASRLRPWVNRVGDHLRRIDDHHAKSRA